MHSNTGIDQRPPNSMSRIAFASMTGTVVEFYDFIIYGTAAALVFHKVFFPELGQAAGTALAFATFGVAFVARPVGSIIFGHFGDRIGRKKTLVSTLLLMGGATVAIGLIPTTSTIGVAAPLLLVALRIAQGLAVGGEWAGAILLASENAKPEKRGFYSLFPQMGPSVGFSLASATFLITALTMSDDAFLAWGWRIPFLTSALLVIVGLYVRLSIQESEEFRGTVERNETVAVPFAEAFRKQSKEVLLGAGAVMTPFAFFYIGVSYLTSYGTQQLELSRPTVLTMGILGGFAFAITTICGSIWSDRFGRRKMMTLGCALGAVTGLVAFPILDRATPTAFLIGLVLILGSVGFVYGPAGAHLPELFATRYRYTGAGVAYSLAGVLGGAVTPLLAARLEASFGSYAVGVCLTVIALISLVSVLALRETRPESITPQGQRVSVR
jgi:metabolite-proton symporter